MTAVGDRVEVTSISDRWSTVKPGDLGTVTFIDSLGTVHVDWDAGQKLGLIPGIDSWRPATAEVEPVWEFRADPEDETHPAQEAAEGKADRQIDWDRDR